MIPEGKKRIATPGLTGENRTLASALVGRVPPQNFCQGLRLEPGVTWYQMGKKRLYASARGGGCLPLLGETSFRELVCP